MGSRAELSLASKGLRPERNAGWLASAGSWCPAGLAMENGEARGLGREHLQVVLALGSLVAPASAVCGDWRREGVVRAELGPGRADKEARVRSQRAHFPTSLNRKDKAF